ncbi:MAG: TRCF domain-containing protein, partial [Clostridiales bacterium]
AQQHQRTIVERFADYPIKSTCLSRFSSPKEQKLILSALAAGGIDIIVGTHRLLSKDVRFKDLGLLIVDEEQRFGVAHKEKIKTFRASIDVLTLSATPIPRTLHMTLVGMRDMSIINTPPMDRRPVQTYVVEYHQKLIRDAIARELARGGQVYYVHNRVFNIYDAAAELRTILPEAQIAIAHGQMNEGELARVMEDFVAGIADVLLCTTIIESGLDIPNVNTLIVDQADMFGLSQLYQLRGRVGRSRRQAFAYFTYRKNKVISDIAKKRLIAIRDFTELGAGFKIAMRDLELRGAGNILGPEQHGNIMAVGFDLYCKLLQEEIAKAEGKKTPPQPIATLLELQLDAFIPDRYLEASVLKVEIYKRITAADSIEEIEELTGELTDRYGDIPPQLVNLLLLGKLKVPARKLAIASMIQKADYIEVKFGEDHPVCGEHLLAILTKWQKRLIFSEKKGFSLRMNTTDINQQFKRVEML